MEALSLIAVGLPLVWISLWVEKNHYSIWTDYLKKYKPKDNRFFDILFRPNYALYRFQVYIMWPLLLAVGVAAVTIGVLSPFL